MAQYWTMKIVATILLGIFMSLLSGCSDPARSVNFKTLQLPSTPNYYLVCPQGYCQSASQVSSTYRLSAAKLASQFVHWIQQQPRVRLVASDLATMQYTFIQRSKIFRFPDYIYLQFIPLSDETATLAIYSRSKYGYSDMGVNRKRVQSWLRHLKVLEVHSK